MQVVTDLNSFDNSQPYDITVIGAGGAGLSAALFAALEGAKVLIIEHTQYVGGTTALSAGTTWVPGTHHAAKVNPNDSIENAARYLDNAVGAQGSAAIREAFLSNGAEAIRVIEEKTEMKYRPYPKHPDYLSELEGSTLAGRALEPLPFDGRLLGDLFALIRPPIPEFTVLGGMMVDRSDINHLLAMKQSRASLKHALKIITRHAFDRLSYSRGTRLVMGNALIGRLLYSLSKFPNVTLLLKTNLVDISVQNEKISGLALQQGASQKYITISRGVILSSGGFNRSPTLRDKFLANADNAWCPAAPGHTGKAQDLARKIGAYYGENQHSPAFWAPVSLRQRADGTQAVFPHFVMDRAKPGMITVNQAGQRFVNESTSYHLFALAMQHANQTSPSIPAYLICDSEALRKYGIGMVRPGGKGLQAFLKDGYLTQAHTLDNLANKLGIDAQGLKQSVQTMNHYAELGDDPDFKRGVTAYQQNIGDANWTGKNPNLGPIQHAPFYAVKLYPGDIGAATGLVTDACARVLRADQSAVKGLYAIGNDMHSMMAGVYTGPGITIGPGLVFGYIAVKDALNRGCENTKYAIAVNKSI